MYTDGALTRIADKHNINRKLWTIIDPSIVSDQGEEYYNGRPLFDNHLWRTNAAYCKMLAVV